MLIEANGTAVRRQSRDLNSALLGAKLRPHSIQPRKKGGACRISVLKSRFTDILNSKRKQ